MPQPDQHSKIGKDTTRSTTQKHRKQRIQRPPFHKSLKQLQRNTDQRRSDHIIKIPAKKNRKRPGDHRIDQNLRPKSTISQADTTDRILNTPNFSTTAKKLLPNRHRIIQILLRLIPRHPAHLPVQLFHPHLF